MMWHWIDLTDSRIIGIVFFKEHLVIVDHSDEGIVDGAHSSDFLGVLDTRSENNRAYSHCHIVGCHLVIRLVVDKLLEELNKELKGIVMENIFLLYFI